MNIVAPLFPSYLQPELTKARAGSQKAGSPGVGSGVSVPGVELGEESGPGGAKGSVQLGRLTPWTHSICYVVWAPLVLP